MTQTISEKRRWTTADLEKIPLDDYRYEIIDGELFVTGMLHWKHQEVTFKIVNALYNWSRSAGLGKPCLAPGIIFSDTDTVIPDVVWISNNRFSALLDENGHLTGAPELVVEVLSRGKENEIKDREIKLKLYSEREVEEYWICDREALRMQHRFQQTIEIYRRQDADLKLTATLSNKDVLTSPLLPGFTCQVARIFA
jgi:Uma2 family endonuclease